MGVYIKGISMPTKDEEIIIRIDSSGTVMTEYALPISGTKAVPVQPHGRLIDADALIERIDGIWDCNDMVFKPNDHCCNVPEDCKGCKWYETKEAIKRIAVAAPTIIPAEEE